MIIKMIVLILVALLILYYIYRVLKYRKLPPGPWGFPIIGYLPFIDRLAPYKTFQMLAEKYGPIYSLRLGSVRAVVLCDPVLVREILRRDEVTARAPLFLTHGMMGGYGLICAEGSLWKDQRRCTINWLKELGATKKVTPFRNAVESRICSGIREFLATIEDATSRQSEFDPTAALQHTLGNVINDLVFGIKYSSNDPEWRYLQELQEVGVKLIGVCGAVNFLPLLRFLPSNRKAIRYILDGKAKTHAIYDRIIRDCEKALEEDRKITKQKPVKDQCILKCFLEERYRRRTSSDSEVQRSAEKMFNNVQLRHLLADLFGAGVDTTLCTLRWFIYYMARYPAYQTQLREILRSLNKEAFTLENLEALDYLRACISETQRIRSVVPLGIPHGTLSPIQVADFIIPAKTMILPLQWAIHMDPKAWPESEEYRPERFLNAEGRYMQPSHFIPFQTGKRMCLGDDLARMLLTLYCGHLIRNFELKLAAGYEKANLSGECGITLSPEHYLLSVKTLNASH